MTDQTDTTEDNEVQKETIDDLFKAEPEKSDEAKGDTEDKPETTEAKAEVKTDKTEETAPPAVKEDESVAGLKKGISEERRKRQDAETRAKDLEEKLAKAADPEVEQVPDPITQPEEYEKYVSNKVNLQALQTKVNLSRDILIDSKEDYLEKEAVFVELARGNPEKGMLPQPHLVAQMNASPNPAKFAYQTAAKHLETLKLSDPKYQEELRAKIREEERAKLLAEQQAKSGKKSALEVPNLTTAAGAGNNQAEVPEKESDLKDIMKDSPL